MPAICQTICFIVVAGLEYAPRFTLDWLSARFFAMQIALRVFLPVVKIKRAKLEKFCLSLYVKLLLVEHRRG